MNDSAAGPIDPESAVWLAQLRTEGPVRDAAIRRLYALLLKEASYEIRHRAATLRHPSGRDLDDLAVQAADDAVLAILGKLDEFRGDARFTTWARRFATLEVPGKIRRRLGHTREIPTGKDHWPAEPESREDPQRLAEISELARTVGRLIASDLTVHQREVLLATTVGAVPSDRLATRLHSTRGAVYKTLHDARAKLRQGLTYETAGV